MRNIVEYFYNSGLYSTDDVTSFVEAGIITENEKNEILKLMGDEEIDAIINIEIEQEDP